MKNKKDKSIWFKVLGALSSITLITASAYIFFVGFSFVSTLFLVSAFAGLAGPAIVFGDGLSECISGFFEMFIEGILSIVEIFSSLFN